MINKKIVAVLTTAFLSIFSDGQMSFLPIPQPTRLKKSGGAVEVTVPRCSWQQTKDSLLLHSSSCLISVWRPDLIRASAIFTNGRSGIFTFHLIDRQKLPDGTIIGSVDFNGKTGNYRLDANGKHIEVELSGGERAEIRKP